MAIAHSLHNPLALVFGHGTQKREEATANWRGEIQVWFVEHFDQRTASVNALDDAHAIDHAARRSIPLSHHQHVASAELVNGLLKLWSTVYVLATRLLAIDHLALLRAQRSDLTV